MVDHLDDPSPLLHSGEDFHSLATVSAEQLLLRWINVQLNGVYHRPVENFGSDLQDGIALGILLRKVAPELGSEEPPSSVEERLERVCADALHCTEFELLTVDALADGHSDIIASFLAQPKGHRRGIGRAIYVP